MSEILEATGVPARRSQRRRQFRLELTERQRDCLVLVGRGKCDREIGEALGISSQTVHKHIEAAKKRCGVSTRVELVLLALFAGNLDIKEMMTGRRAMPRKSRPLRITT